MDFSSRTLDGVQCLGIFVQELILGLVGDVRTLLGVAQIVRELAVPVRNVRGVDEMFLADIAKRLRQQGLVRFKTKKDRTLAHAIARALLERGRLESAALFP